MPGRNVGPSEVGDVLITFPSDVHGRTRVPVHRRNILRVLGVILHVQHVLAFECALLRVVMLMSKIVAWGW